MINDNLTYPIREPIVYNSFINNNESFFPQSIYMERRFHISPPGETTQYVINEIYLEAKINEENIRYS